MEENAPVEEKKQNRKRKRIQNNERPNRRGRLIVRNLPFKTTEDKLRKHFEEFGPITEVKILKRPDGKLVGCGFIQYDVVQNAAKAIHHRSGKDFMGRPIICDWALGKNTYVKNLEEFAQKKVKEEPIEIKEEADDDVVEIKQESDNEKESESEKEDSDQESEDSEESEDSDDDDDDEENEIEAIKEPEKKRPKVISNDVNEGKTVFIKNVPFQATNEDVKECMQQFGHLYYALVCVDPITEHSKGTAFVKFQNEEDAQKCLEAGTELTLMGNILDCHKAVNKNDLQNKKEKKEDKKDSRNLYLVKEGVILAGSKAGQTVSASDMAKRLQLERWKTQMLRNLNMFVSKYRLVIHNLPITYDDNKFRQLITRYVDSSSTIKECRVMRDLRNLDSEGKGKSKEYGFVSFQTHEDAIKVLRAMNNNPNIFTETHRPIVSFSIENKKVLNARHQRLEKSRQNNPTFNKTLQKDSQSDKSKGKKFQNKKGKPEENSEENVFSGVKAKVGETKLRSKFKLNKQATIHHENMKMRKKQLKNKKDFKQSRKDFIRQPQQKQNTKKKKKGAESDTFSKLVNTYKSKISVGNQKIKSKWYE